MSDTQPDGVAEVGGGDVVSVRPAPVVVDDAEHVGRLAAELLLDRVAARPRLRVLLPAGATPRQLYAALRRRAAGAPLPLEAFALDEYAGLAPDDPHSFAAELSGELAPLRLDGFHHIDGAAPDPAVECARYERALAAAPIDLAVLGLGHTGHVAFNEPGSQPGDGVRVVELDALTRADAAPAFGGTGRVPARGMTVGPAQILAAREILLLVTGAAKAGILHDVLTQPATPALPATLLRRHPRLTVICDAAAASALPLPPHARADHVAIVLGHREPGISREHRISHESLERLRRAEHLVRGEPTRAAILTGYTSTDSLSEAEQMALAWREGEVPLLLEVGGRNTAGNAGCSLPLVLALGGVRRVTVVTSAWHIRAPYFFAPYRRHGIDVRFRREWRGRGWLRLLRRELREAPHAPAERRQAMRGDRALPPVANLVDT